MKLLVKKGKTSKRVLLEIQDSSSATGAYKTGLTSSNVSISYSREDDGNAAATTVSVTAGTRGTWSTGTFVEKDATNAKGEYEFSVPNAALAGGSDTVVITLQDAGSNNIAPLKLEIQLVDFDPQDAVHLGLTALPNTACTTNASLITSGSGTDQLTVSGGLASSDAKKVNAVSTSSVSAVGAFLGNATHALTVDASGFVTVATNNDKTGYSLTVSPPTAAAVATAVWQDATGGDFTVVSSIGKSLYTSGSAPGASGGLPTVDASNNIHGVQPGTGTGQINVASGKVPATLASADVSGNVPADAKAINAVSTASVSAVGAFLGNATHALTVDSSGFVTFSNTTIATATNLTNAPTGGDFTADMKTSLNAATPAVIDAGLGQVSMTTTTVTVSGGTVKALPGALVDVWDEFSTSFQTRTITAVDGTATVLTVDRPWDIVYGSTGGLVTRRANAPALDAGLSVTALVSVGTGAGQVNASGGKIPATLVSRDVTGNLPADVASLNGNTASLTYLVSLLSSLPVGSVDTATLAATTLTFETSFTTNRNLFENQALVWTSGSNKGLTCRILGYAYTGHSKVQLTLGAALPVTPSNGDAFLVIGRING